MREMPSKNHRHNTYERVKAFWWLFIKIFAVWKAGLFFFFFFLSLLQHSRTFPRWDSTVFYLRAAQIFDSETGQCWVSFIITPWKWLAPTEGSTWPLMNSFLLQGIRNFSLFTNRVKNASSWALNSKCVGGGFLPKPGNVNACSSCAEVQGSCSTHWDQEGQECARHLICLVWDGSAEESRTRNAHPLITVIWNVLLIPWKEQESLRLRGLLGYFAVTCAL